MLSTQLLRRVLAEALASGGDFAELYVEDARSAAVSLEDDRLERLSFGHDRGAGVRVTLGEVTGYAHTDDLGKASLLEAARIARTIARGAARTQLASLRRRKPGYQVAVERVAATAPEAQKVDLVRRANAAARAAGPEVRQVTVRYTDAAQRVQIANSEGLLAEDERLALQLVVAVTAQRDGLLQVGQRARGGQTGLELFDAHPPEGVGAEAARVALQMLDARPAPAGRMAVVITKGWGGVLFHEAVGHGLEADAVTRGSSVYAGKLGQAVANPLVTLVDDATIPGHRGSYRFDDEGTPAQRTPLVDRGTLVGYLSDRRSARRLGQSSSGNGRRQSYQHLPVPRMSNLFIQNGTTEPGQIVADTPRGLLVVSLGGGMVDPAKGDFVFSVTEGYLIEHGRVASPVRGATIAGDSFGVLASIDAVGDDFALDPGQGTCGKLGQWVPVGVGQPTLRVSEVLVGGTA
ncbi:MAG: TldD/PmbA family protein [Chloroflexi bacterium]|nr:TldD/PmbA family protein [Chloroflexota bacterium]